MVTEAASSPRWKTGYLLVTMRLCNAVYLLEPYYGAWSSHVHATSDNVLVREICQLASVDMGAIENTLTCEKCEGNLSAFYVFRFC